MSSVFKREKSTKPVPQSSSATAAPELPGTDQQQSQGAVPSEAVAIQELEQEPAKTESFRQERPAEETAAA